jgi:SAM-dependent methyltransferase
LVGAPTFVRRLQWPAIAELLELAPEHVVLDVGCGDLQLSVELAKRDVRAVIAIDPTPRLGLLGYVARRFPRLRVVRSDGGRLPLADASVDRVLASSVLQMVPQPGRLLAECRRVLKAGGRLVVTVPEAYCYLPRLFRNGAAYDDFLQELNRMFGVEGTGYVREGDLVELLRTAGFQPASGARVPGPIGSFIWEASLAASHRLRDSRVPVLLAFALYPLARLEPRGDRGRRGCELVMAAVAS